MVFALAMSLLSCGSEQNTIEIETKSNPVGYQNKNDLRKINIEGYSYTAEEIRLFLYETLTSAKMPQVDKLYLWHKKRVGYSYYASAELNYYDPAHIDKTMQYFSSLTGIEFYKADNWGDIDIFIGLSTNFTELKDLEYIRELSSVRNKGDMSGYDEKWKKLEDSELNTFKRAITAVSTANSNTPQLFVVTAFHSFKKLPYDEIKIKRGVVSLLVESMIYGVGVPFDFDSSAHSKDYLESPYISPFDEALLKIIYGDPNLAGMQLDKAIDQIVETFVQQYGE